MTVGLTSPGAIACRAPAVAMHFSLAGDVHACCQNGRYSYGNVNAATLREIWVGLARRVMADDLAHDLYPAGCELCEVEHALGNRAATPAQAFDQFEDGSSVWPRQLEFMLSNRCNLACIQCNGDNSSTIRAQREHRPPMPMPYTDAFFEQLPPFLEHAEVTSFLGGEPFLAPQAKRVWGLLLAAANRPVVRVTTNATVWSDDVERYVHGLRMHVAVSIDGATRETYESIRVGASFDRVVRNRDRLLAACRDHGGTFHLNYCLLRENWHEVGRFLVEADALDVDANVIPVFAPSRYSLFTLPHHDLAPIVDRLVAEGEGLRPRLGRNGPHWDALLERLQEQCSRVGFPADRERQLVRIRQRHDERQRRRQDEQRRRKELLAGLSRALDHRLSVVRARTAAEIAARVEADLRRWAGRECIEISTDGDVVVSVRAPAWAAALETEGWVGTDIARIGDVAASTVGAVAYDAPQDRSGGLGLVLVNDSVVASPTGTFRFRTMRAPLLGRLAIASPDPVARSVPAAPVDVP